mmetsp:Transcript_80105/g.156639  ORF Transcript_80105/g.156639 Transcript_80105/m.156639 type:complete len:278 (+) Transcript_80105:99-932(+)|eukprot:CAMPEP_0171609104 /NCGR_PEP_ID=MMETSP0990-20121206/9294_1 /TAXON_ID=483369 /ORGANISM="non described non described, Strain CCMP2098" /LENGTH=277 /DNA_ID=CAMNT_0012172337 /DNA_START=94 /DNA_END=927 /DNA_ORIENTATION=-
MKLFISFLFGALSSLGTCLQQNPRQTTKATFTALDRGLRLQQTARSLVGRGNVTQAVRLYETHIFEFGSIVKTEGTETEDHVCTARSYLLLALSCQRVGRINDARLAFREGAERFERTAKERDCAECRAWAARLYQSWGLLESKLGHLPLAWALVTKAVCLDKSNEGVLRWAMWRSLKPHMRRPTKVLRIAFWNIGSYETAKVLREEQAISQGGASKLIDTSVSQNERMRLRFKAPGCKLKRNSVQAAERHSGPTPIRTEASLGVFSPQSGPRGLCF